MKNFLKSPTAAGAVTLASFVASAAHIVTVVDATNPFAVALVYPIGIDGLLYIGIRALQTGRKGVGAVALLVGAIYSLGFNAHAEKAIEMHPLLIAASMPICFLAGVLIESTTKDDEPAAAPASPAPVIEARIASALAKLDRIAEAATLTAAKPAPIAAPRRITWVGAGSRRELPIVSTRPARIVATISTPKAVSTPKARPAISSRPETKTAGRSIGWDVAEAVRLMDENKTNDEVGSKVGVAPKQIQRARRVLGFVRSSDMSDAEIRETIGNQLSIPVIAAIRGAAA